MQQPSTTPQTEAIRGPQIPESLLLANRVSRSFGDLVSSTGNYPKSLTIRFYGTRQWYADSSVRDEFFSVAEPRVADPTFGPVNRNVLINQELIITAATDDDTVATIYYTTDGSDPRSTGEGVTRNEYNNAMKPKFGSFGGIYPRSVIIRAFAEGEGYSDSTVVDATFNVGYPDTVATPTFSLSNEVVTPEETVTIRTGTEDGNHLLHHGLETPRSPGAIPAAPEVP